MNAYRPVQFSYPLVMMAIAEGSSALSKSKWALVIFHNCHDIIMARKNKTYSRQGPYCHYTGI